MKRKIFLSLTVLNAVLLRFYQIGNIPVLTEKSSLNLRYISAVSGSAAVILLYFYISRRFVNYRIALLSSWIFGILPWTIEQGRIASQVNVALFFLLLLLIIIQLNKNKLIRFLAVVSAPFIFLLTYPSFWMIRNFQIIPSDKFFNNLLILFSPGMWFSSNITFWSGGLREWGFIYLSFLPFILSGIYETFISGRYGPVLWITVIGIISATSPFFPESREFYLAVPFISTICAFGLNKLLSYRTKGMKVFLTLLFLLIIYELSQLCHFYFVHYPIQVNGDLSKITGSF